MGLRPAGTANIQGTAPYVNVDINSSFARALRADREAFGMGPLNPPQQMIPRWWIRGTIFCLTGRALCHYVLLCLIRYITYSIYLVRPSH